MRIANLKNIFAWKSESGKGSKSKGAEQTDAPMQTEEQKDFVSFSARNPGTTSLGAGISTLIATAAPGVLAAVAATALPGIGPAAVGALNMFSAFSIAGAGASAYVSGKKSKKAYLQNRRDFMRSGMSGNDIPQRGSIWSTTKTLAKSCLKRSALGTLAAAAATAAVQVGLSVAFTPLVGMAFAAGCTYLMMPSLTHNVLNSNAVPGAV